MLSFLLIIPIIGSLLLLYKLNSGIISVTRIKQIALITAMVIFILSVVLWGDFNPGSVENSFVPKLDKIFMLSFILIISVLSLLTIINKSVLSVRRMNNIRKLFSTMSLLILATIIITLLVFTDGLSLIQNVYCQSEPVDIPSSSGSTDEQSLNKGHFRSVTPEQAVGGLTTVIVTSLSNPLAGLGAGLLAQDMVYELSEHLHNSPSIGEAMESKAKASFTPGSPGTGLQEEGLEHLYKNAEHEVANANKSLTENLTKVKKANVFGGTILESFLESIYKWLPKSIPNRDLSELPASSNNIDLYNRLAKRMYVCLVGAFSNLYIIALIYFVPLAIKRVEHLLPNKAVTVLNWFIRYRVLASTLFAFLLLNNLLAIVYAILTMVNNPL